MRRRAPASRLGAMVLLPVATMALCVWPLSCRAPESATMDSAVTPHTIDAEVPVAAATVTASVPVLSAVGTARTNDSANTGGDVERLGARIDAMMALIGPDHPALWTTTRTLHDRGPYQNAHMQSWTQALTQACTRHPNMRVYDWASEVKDEWFSKDGIHPGSTGYRERAARIARSLARAFPKDGAPPAACLVGSD